MSPKELTQAKKAATIEPRDNIDWFYQETIQNLCTHIDAQAAEIEILKMGEKAADRLILQGRQCEEQIEVLKEKLIDERAKMFHQFGDMELDATESDRQQARQQLAQEMPEVDWSE